jgi:hypothetical protein
VELQWRTGDGVYIVGVFKVPPNFLQQHSFFGWSIDDGIINPIWRCDDLWKEFNKEIAT